MEWRLEIIAGIYYYFKFLLSKWFGETNTLYLGQ